MVDDGDCRSLEFAAAGELPFGDDATRTLPSTQKNTSASNTEKSAVHCSLASINRFKNNCKTKVAVKLIRNPYHGRKCVVGSQLSRN